MATDVHLTAHKRSKTGGCPPIYVQLFIFHGADDLRHLDPATAEW
jgi:hypothetical protein